MKTKPTSSHNGSKCTNGPGQKQIKLYKYEDMPSFLQDNHYIWTGYRKDLSPELCFKSVFMWTNETINIWSHFLTFFVFFILMIDVFINYLPKNDGDIGDYVSTTISFVSLLFSMLASSGFHAFHCQPSDAPYCKWLIWDLNGVAIINFGALLTYLRCMFYCDPFTLTIYITIAIGLVCYIIHSSFYIPTKCGKLHEEMILKHKFRCAGLGVIAIISAVHFVLEKGWASEDVNLLIPIMIKFYLILVFGTVIYVSRFPECLFPGKMDYVGSSHNWWHLVVTCGTVFWYTSLRSMIEYTKVHGCPS